MPEDAIVHTQSRSSAVDRKSANQRMRVHDVTSVDLNAHYAGHNLEFPSLNVQSYFLMG